MPAIRKFLDLSTAHLSRQDRYDLDYYATAGCHVGPSVAKHVYGWWVYVSEDPDERLSPTLERIREYARQHDCDGNRCLTLTGRKTPRFRRSMPPNNAALNDASKGGSLANALLGIEAMRVLITKDSVKLLDKLNKTYTARSVSYLQDVTDLPLDLKILQDLIIGNAVFLDSNIVSYSNGNNVINILSVGRWFKNLLT